MRPGELAELLGAAKACKGDELPDIPLVIGYFCPTPENVKSAHMRFLLLLEHLAPVPWITIAGRQGIKVHG